MSDNPRRSVNRMRHQLKILLENDQGRQRQITDCTSLDDYLQVGIDRQDAEMLNSMNYNSIRELFEISTEDAQELLNMSNEIQLLGASKYSDQRHEFLLRRNFIIAKNQDGLAEALKNKKAAERIVRWINTEQNGSPETNKDYRTAFRMFGEIVTQSEGKPESIEWVPGGYPSNYDPAPEPAKMYRWKKHILPMIEVCYNSRDKALIALDWDLGPRPTELFELTVGRFSDAKHGTRVTLKEGKQGTRSPMIVPSVPYVRKWLDDHPASDDPEAPLWTRVNKADPISDNRIRDILNEKAEAANMVPPSKATPSRMRKSSASYLASRGVSQAHIEDHHGWRRGSKVAARYIAVFSDANDREIAKAHGVEIDEDEEENTHAPITCPRCRRETEPEKSFCSWCGQALSQNALERVDNNEAEVRRAALKLVQNDPDVVDDIKSAEKLMILLEDSPELQRELFDIASALEETS